MEPTEKWSQEFLDRRMAEHKRWQHAVEYALMEDIIDEIQALPKRQPKTGRLFLNGEETGIAIRQ
jgi:hypothetical protein